VLLDCEPLTLLLPEPFQLQQISVCGLFAENHIRLLSQILVSHLQFSFPTEIPANRYVSASIAIWPFQQCQLTKLPFCTAFELDVLSHEPESNQHLLFSVIETKLKLIVQYAYKGEQGTRKKEKGKRKKENSLIW
jgi:hypothetical protein